MKLIIGLGNPGKKYQNTRHNVGFLVVNRIADDLNGEWRVVNKLKAQIAKVRIGRNMIVLAKPMTFMNNAGQAVSLIAKYYKVVPDEILVISDDLNLELGKIRMRKGGEDGGHKGLKSVIENIGRDFWRIRIGIGENGSIAAEDYVLQKFNQSEIEVIDNVVSEVAASIMQIVK